MCDNSHDLRFVNSGRHGPRGLDSSTLATSAIERHDSLAPGTVLRDYTIESVIGHGGFGIVYRARHDELGIVVAIKEYLPIELAVRQGATVRARSDADSQGYEEGLKRFRDEARALIQFHSHPNIVSCREYFRSNGTAYLVMEFVDGQSLAQVLASREAEGVPFEESDLLAVMVPLLEGLDYVHSAWILHRDIKPSNILIRRRDERPVLIDFGAAKQLVANRSKSMAPYTEGYAALEQVANAGELGPWTDIYGVGAVMWRMVAGGPRPWEPPNPVSVESRSHAFVRGTSDPLPSASELGKGRLSTKVLESIDQCLTLSETERVQGCKELLGILKTGSAKAVKAEDHKPATRNPEPTEVIVPDEAGSSEGATDDDPGTGSFTLASFASRLVAAAVDIAVIALVPVLSVFFFIGFVSTFASANHLAAFLIVCGIVVLLFYESVLAKLRTTTVGGLVARIHVVRSDGAPLQVADALRRGFSTILLLAMGFFGGWGGSKWLIDSNYWGDEEQLLWGWLGSALTGLLGLLWVLWDPRMQGLHDKMANTYVVRTRPPRDIFRLETRSHKRSADRPRDPFGPWH